MRRCSDTPRTWALSGEVVLVPPRWVLTSPGHPLGGRRLQMRRCRCPRESPRINDLVMKLFHSPS